MLMRTVRFRQTPRRQQAVPQLVCPPEVETFTPKLPLIKVAHTLKADVLGNAVTETASFLQRNADVVLPLVERLREAERRKDRAAMERLMVEIAPHRQEGDKARSYLDEVRRQVRKLLGSKVESD